MPEIDALVSNEILYSVLRQDVLNDVERSRLNTIKRNIQNKSTYLQELMSQRQVYIADKNKFDAEIHEKYMALESMTVMEAVSAKRALSSLTQKVATCSAHI